MLEPAAPPAAEPAPAAEGALSVADRGAVQGVLAAAVSELGGQERAGQVQMAQAVADAMVDGKHLLVQAGTGTGKSLAYLVPSLLHKDRVVVATATLALQHQLVERDLPPGAIGVPRRVVALAAAAGLGLLLRPGPELEHLATL